MQSLVTARAICDEDTDATSDDSEEEIIEEFAFASSDDTSDGELHPQLITTTRSGRVAGSWRNVFIQQYAKFSNYVKLYFIVCGGGGGGALK